MKTMFKMLGVFVATLFVANVALALNDIDVEQIGLDNNSVTVQDGVGNDLDLWQGDQGNNDIDSKQDGSNNTGWIDQDGNNTSGAGVLDNEIDLVQTGDDNNARIKQDAQGTAAGETGTNMVDVTQTGNDNELRGAQVNVGVAVQTTTATSTAMQTSAKGSNSLTSNQTNGENEAGLSQTAEGNNTADIFQEGDDRLASVQESTNTGGTNFLDVDQLSGAVNVASNYQTGADSNSYTIIQTP